MNESFSFDLVSHPDRTLAEHLLGCDRVSAQVLTTKYFSDEFFSKTELEHWRKLLVYFHDFGKATDYFQAKILGVMELEKVEGFYERQKPYLYDFKRDKLSQVTEELRLDDRLSNHALLGAYLLFSNFSHPDPVVEYLLLRVIRRHHGFLTNFSADSTGNPQLRLTPESIIRLEKQLARFNWRGYNKVLGQAGISVQSEIWAALKTDKRFNSALRIDDVETYLKRKPDYRYFFLQHYLFSLLLSADKGDMMLRLSEDRLSILKPNRLIPGEVVEQYKQREFSGKPVKEIDLRREEAFLDVQANAKRHGKGGFFSLTLPTGMGKTFAAYQAAIELQRQYAEQFSGSVPRIVYCLPFTSVIDQNAQILESIFEANGLPTDWISMHHYLSSFNEKYDARELTEGEGEYLAEGWEQEVVVTTFVQFLETIFSNENRTLRKFHNLTHAVVVLDEVQAIPPKYFEVIEIVFREMNRYFGTKFLFVTATQPYLFAEHGGIVELTDPSRKKTSEYFQEMSRITLDQSLLRSNAYQSMELEALKALFQADVDSQPERSFLFICNTIKQSQKVYEYLAGQNTNVLYLSSSILPRRRRQLIGLIKRNINRGIRQIVVSTQVVEAGVDIDLDVVYRDWAPLDSINQSAGRCNRNGVRGQGTVKLFHAGKAKHIYAPALLDATKEVLEKQGDDIAEGTFFTLNDAYARRIRRKVADVSNESDALKKAVKSLQLEEVNKMFSLIDDNQQAYNVFIPYSGLAERIWRKYIECCKIEDRFERKRAIKKLSAQMLPYVTRFPKNKYSPDPKDKEKFIIRERAWKDYYDLRTGFKHTEPFVAVL